MSLLRGWNGSLSVLARLRANDEDEQACFYREHRPTIVAIARNILGDGLEADDLADEVLVDFLFGAVQRLSHEEAMRGYLRLMTVRRALRRSRKRKLNVQVRESDLTVADGEDSVAVRLLLPRLEQCLEVLTPQARRAVLLKYRRELTHEHIGRLVGGSRQYISRVLSKSLDVLRECIERKEVEHDRRSPAAQESPRT